MVYMCNCWGSSTNIAWIDIGAQVAIGPYHNNYMPEPTTTDFLALWAQEGEKASDAASGAYDAAKIAYWLIPIPLPGLIFVPAVVGAIYEIKGWFGDSRLIVDGPNKAITKNWLYPGKPDFPEDLTNLPPFLKDVVVAQPPAQANPSGFGAFPNQPANVRYSGSWSGGCSSSNRGLVLSENGLLDPGRLALIFLRFGPLDANGRSREMKPGTLSLAASTNSSSLLSKTGQTCSVSR